MREVPLDSQTETGVEWRSGQRALERCSVCRRAVGREHHFDRQREQGPQSLEDLLASDAAAQPLVERESRPDVRQRIPCDDCTGPVDPQNEVIALAAGVCLSPDRQPIARPVPADGMDVATGVVTPRPEGASTIDT
jgi:hypothetical protein